MGSQSVRGSTLVPVQNGAAGYPYTAGYRYFAGARELAKLRERRGVNTHDKFIVIRFDSSQFEVVNGTTGEFDFGGQD